MTNAYFFVLRLDGTLPQMNICISSQTDPDLSQSLSAVQGGWQAAFSADARYSNPGAFNLHAVVDGSTYPSTISGSFDPSQAPIWVLEEVTGINPGYLAKRVGTIAVDPYTCVVIGTEPCS